MLSKEFYDIRYQFLLRSGNYIHPEANQLGSKPMEAEPAFFHICSADDRLFIKHCAPQMALEELNTFKTSGNLSLRDSNTEITVNYILGIKTTWKICVTNATTGCFDRVQKLAKMPHSLGYKNAGVKLCLLLFLAKCLRVEEYQEKNK